MNVQPGIHIKPRHHNQEFTLTLDYFQKTDQPIIRQFFIYQQTIVSEGDIFTGLSSLALLEGLALRGLEGRGLAVQATVGVLNTVLEPYI